MTETRARLGLFIDACCEVLDEGDLKLTPFTRNSWEGLDKEMCERVLWELEDLTPDEVARKLGVEVGFVEKLSQLPGANGGSRTLPARAA